jgi:RHS repeat-associated protein
MPGYPLPKTVQELLKLSIPITYYPFGLNHISGPFSTSGFGSFYSYKYNGKELQQTGMFDYGWRQYMPDLGRWNEMDQLSESYLSTSPSAYVANNPVSMRDPDGRWMDANGHIDTSGYANPFMHLGKTRSLMTQFEGQYPGEGGGGGNYWAFGQTQAYADMMNSFQNGGDFSLKVKNGYMSWWTGGAEGDANTSQEMIGHMLKLSNSNVLEIRRPSYYLPGQEGFDWGRVGNAMTGGGIAYYALEKSIYSKYHWVDSKGIVKSTNLLEKGANGKFVRGVQGLRNGYAAAGKAASPYALAGKVVGAAGMGVTAIQYLDGQITGVEASVDLAMGAIGFTPWGAPISIAYFAGKFLYEYSTGDTLFDKPIRH